ncbi:MAG: hypothetical protein NTW21_19175 [Verrucomicrobia bacterium]|nr:hypothetical protein [Verrucomicrobiota bacterium]
MNPHSVTNPPAAMSRRPASARPLRRASRLGPPAGFVLVITLSLMVLLTLLAVGLLSLSSIALRTSAQGLAMAEARANARVALLLALGQLQVEMGPDRRISSTSGILDSNPATPAFDDVVHPHLTGVWDAAESPLPKWTLDRPSYDKKSGFRGWLISGTESEIRKLALARTGFPAETPTRVLVGPGANPAARHGVTVPVVVAGERAGFAWWTSDDGVKAVLRAGEKPDQAPASRVLLAAHRMDGDGHAAIDAKVPDRDRSLDGRLVDLAAVDAAVPSPAGESRAAWRYSHDLTTRSEIVPVDVTTGELRKCLNLKLDWLNTLSPALRTKEGTFGKMKNALADYRLFSWDQLRNYESLSRTSSMLTLSSATGRPTIHTYKQFGYSAAGSPGEPEWNPIMGEDRFRIQPVLLKLCYVVSYATERLPAPQPADKPLALRFYIYPLAVLWNPYNVDLLVPEYSAGGGCPLTFFVNKGGTDPVTVDMTKNQSGTSLGFGPEMGGTKKLSNLIIPAGATLVLYPQVVDWMNHPDDYRNSKFIWAYCLWAETGKFNLGDNNFGGVVKNLRGNQEVAYFNSIPGSEIMGAAGDPLKIEVQGPSGRSVDDLVESSFAISGSNTDWGGNNGSGTDTVETAVRFGNSTVAYFKAEADGTSPQVSLVAPSEIPTRTFGQVEGRPTPLMFFEAYRKPADEDLFPAKHGSFSVAGNPIHGITSKKQGTADVITPWFESPYTYRYRAVNSWLDITKTFQLPPNRDDRVYFGASYSPRGQLNVVDQEIPVTPLVSLAQLQHLPLFDYRPTYEPRLPDISGMYTFWYTGDYVFYEGHVTQFPQNHAIGNSYASPGIPANKLNTPGWNYMLWLEGAAHLRTDRSYIANAHLWDAWFCSTLAAQDGRLLVQGGAPRTARKVAEDFFNGTTPLPNDALLACTNRPAKEMLDLLFDAAGNPTKTALSKIAEFIRIQGGFNINSVSAEAWMHFLSGLMSRPSMMLEAVTGTEAPVVLGSETGKFLVSRHTLANAPPAERAAGQEAQNRYWNGSRELTSAQLRELAAAIVRQVKKRGPFTSLAEFVNRRLSSDPELAVSGALQSALDDPAVSINAPFRGDSLTGAESVVSSRPTYPFPEAAKGPRRQGITGYVTQADLLATLGPAISPRSDTFTLRVLGEARDAKGTVLARAWCEAVAQRTASYLDPVETATTAPPKSPANVRFGRRFEIVSFRWLQPQEVQAQAAQTSG